jgi:hypothetical protein
LLRILGGPAFTYSPIHILFFLSLEKYLPYKNILTL